MRLKRICSTAEKFNFRLNELKNKLISRQYKPKIIDEAFERIRKISRKDALKRVEKTPQQREAYHFSPWSTQHFKNSQETSQCDDKPE